MEETTTVSYEFLLELVKWGAGILSGAIVFAVGVIAFFWRRDRKGIDLRFEKGDKKFDEIQQDIHKLAVQIAEQVPALKESTANNTKLIDILLGREKKRGRG